MISKIEEIIRNYKGTNDITITDGTNIREDLGMSSFDLIQLACAVEDEFDIEIPDRAIKDFKTVGDLIAFIENQ